MGAIGGLLFLLGVVDLIYALKSDDDFLEKLFHFATGIMFIVGAFMIWRI